MSITVKLQDCEISAEAGYLKIFPGIAEKINNDFIKLEFEKKYFDLIYEFAEWYCNLSAALRKTARDVDVLRGEKERGKNQKIIRGFVDKFIQKITGTEFTFKFIEIANSLGFEPLEIVSCLPISNAIKSLSLAELKKKFSVAELPESAIPEPAVLEPAVSEPAVLGSSISENNSGGNSESKI